MPQNGGIFLVVDTPLGPENMITCARDEGCHLFELFNSTCKIYSSMEQSV